ncbi:putative membrane protein [Synechococcus sp. PROS-9-1]|uniref:hypothetical protein n=1 Tax=Synechococcus sp. PROS-9-1 TaxID=1968775 RepID=UPI001861582C|nr:hypothetical protein [Synechococcus sp. PROS-9-1]QNJ30625.1 putative membrane protein [Synechococcus sp. PROS-9-1]
MTKLSIFTQLVLLGSILTYSKFEPIPFGSTANPSILLAILLWISFCASPIPKICIGMLQRAFIYIPISAFFAYLFISDYNLSLDPRFVLTSLCFFIYSTVFIGFGVYLSSIYRNNFPEMLSLCRKLLDSLILLLCVVTPLNILSLHCNLFKCREYGGSLGFSLINSEPSYVGIFLFSIITFSFYIINDFRLCSYSSLRLRSKFLIILSIVLLLSSKSPLAVASVGLYAAFILFIHRAVPILKNWKFVLSSRFSFPQLVTGTIFLITISYALFNTKVGIEFVSLLNPSVYLPNNQSESNPFQVLVFLGGNRISYLGSLYYVNPLLLISGHSIFSSSLIFENSVNLFYQNVMKVGFFSEYGAKPHSAFGQLMFTFGFLGSLFIYLPVFKLFFQNISTIFRSKTSYIALWIIFSPLFLLLYFTPNTDPWKFCTLTIFVVFTSTYPQLLISRNPRSL